MQTDQGLVFINGEITSPQQAKISVFDRGFLFGDSVYEVTRSYNGTLAFIDEHLDRLTRSAEQIALSIPYSKVELKQLIEELMIKISSKDNYVRIILTRGEGKIGLDPGNAGKANLIIIMSALPKNPEWWYREGVKFIISTVMRNDPKSLDPNIKSGNYLNNVLAMIEAKKQDAFDAFMLNRSGLVTEGTTNNVWIVKNKKITTPPLSDGILAGITRTTLLSLLKESDLKFEEESISVERLKDADEVFITSSTKEVVPVTQIDGTNVGAGKPGEIFQEVRKIYSAYIQRTYYS